MQLQPYNRQETLPNNLIENRGAIADRIGTNGYAGTNGHVHAHTNRTDQHYQDPSYLQVLLHHCKLRWKLLIVWMIVTTALAAVVLKKYGKPLWRSEGSLYYSPDFRKALYTPPNIQTVIAIIKSPEILDQICKEKGLDATSDQLQKNLNITVLRNSDLITVQFDWADREQSLAITERVQELALEQYDHLRSKLLRDALTKLDLAIKDTDQSIYEAKKNLYEKLKQKGISDLRVEKEGVIREIDGLHAQILKADSDAAKLSIKILQTEIQMKELENQKPDETNSDPSLLASINQMQQQKMVREREMGKAKAELEGKLQDYNKLLPIYKQGYIAEQEMTKLRSEIKALKVIASGDDEIKQMTSNIDKLMKQMLAGKTGTNSLPLQQAKMNLLLWKAEQKGLPAEINGLRTYVQERKSRLAYLETVEKEVIVEQQKIDSLIHQSASQMQQKMGRSTPEQDKNQELNIHAKANVGKTPVSSNYAKLVVLVFGVSLVLFVGLVALRDLPRTSPTGDQAAEQLELQVLAKYQSSPSVTPAPARVALPDPTSAQLRHLADRIGESTGGGSAIVLFAPASFGLRIEALVADLGCFCAQKGGRVLVFDARPRLEQPHSPAWVSQPTAEAEKHLIDYLAGQSDQFDRCFVESLIHSIYYTHCDLQANLGGAMAMYRFRRLAHELRESFKYVLMITPERYRGGEDDFFCNIAEGIVVVLGENSNPIDVESYVQSLRESDTHIFGAVTVPQGSGS